MSDNKKLHYWVELALKNEDIVNYNIDVHGKTNKDDGYLGDITFVTVTGKSKAGKSKTVDLVVKSSKESDTLRKQFPIKEIFEKEIYIYDRVLAAFESYQKEKGLKDPLQTTPFCYATQSADKKEVLILENLKAKDYHLLDRKVPMDLAHLETVLEAYGKWHALSLGLKREKPQEFQELTRDNLNMFCEIFNRTKIINVAEEKFNKTKAVLVLNDEVEALRKLNFSREDIEYVYGDLFNEDPEHQVILHGDGWTNNFMFKYEKDSERPTDIRILDWQCSALGSPVIDLSYFFYTCCPKEGFDNFDGLLRVYHGSLSAQLRKLGLDPDEVFSYETLVSHWKRFSRYGIITTAFVLTFSLCEADEAPDFAEAAERGVEFLDNFDFGLKNEDKYLERVKCNLLNYVKYA